MKTKRITIPINGNIDAIKLQLKAELGVEFSYTQLVDYLIKFYRKNNRPVTVWATQK
jgi:hypothetical protein